MAATKILRCYPDYGKAPPEYVAGLMAVLERYPVQVMQLLADPVTGIPSRVKFLPTIADLVEMADPLLKATQERERGRAKGAYYSSLRPMSMEQYAQVRAEDPTDLARRNAVVRATLGYDPARQEARKWCFTPPPPKVDISDFPDGGHPVRVEEEIVELMRATE